MQKSLRILGTRGIPANHGGFETFAEYLSLYLVKNGWKVTVYCQQEGQGDIFEDQWNGITRVNIPIKNSGALGTIIFDYKSTLHAARSKSLVLTLGYNTAIFSILYRIKKTPNIINMDGIEWKRDKWSFLERLWLYTNERMGCLLANHLIADHPEIKNHLMTRVQSSKITMIPYGADVIEEVNITHIKNFSLEPKKYAIVIARPEPENSILEIVTAFSRRKREIKLVVLGNIQGSDSSYCSKIINCASDEVVFPGAIYDKPVIHALRHYSLLYIHGHQVGGTNPSLVEALGAYNPVLAHNNKYNSWVAGSESEYFNDVDDCDEKLTKLFSNEEKLFDMEQYSKKRHTESFTWNDILVKYEDLLLDY
jgi:glycosyltransferase involved in cell wall biosynthesis